MHWIGLVAFTIGFHEDDAVPSGFGLCFRVGEAVNQHMGAYGPVADHHFAAVDDIVSAVSDG